MDQATFLKEIHYRLTPMIDQEYLAGHRRFFTEEQEIKLIGVRTNLVRDLGKTLFPKVKPLPMEEMITLAEAMFETGWTEYRTLANSWLTRRKTQLGVEHIPLFRKWIRSYCGSWADTDDFCMFPLGHLMERHPEALPELYDWAKDENRWVRRASAVAMVRGGRKQAAFRDAAFELVERLMGDGDDLVEKAAGWLLKTVGKPFPEEMHRFVRMHRKALHPTALRIALEKTSPQKRAEILAD